MNLAIDIGNTRTKLGLFSQNTLVEQAVWTTWTFGQLSDWATERQVRRVMLSSVAAPDAALLANLSRQFDVLELTSATPLPFVNDYLTPLTLGKDRLAGVAGARALFPDTHCLVIDCGTCVKYELLTASGHYRGGNIAPGLQMRTEAMHHFTARLPVVERALPNVPVGNSTQTALQNGAFRGALLEMAGFVGLFANEVAQHHGGGNLQVVLTGGDADWALSHWLGPTDPPVTLEPELTLIGLNEILTWNTAF